MEARSVLSTIAPDVTAMLVGTSIVTPDQVPVRAACLDVALRRLPKPDLHFALGLDQPLYFSVHSVAAHLTQGTDHAVLHVLRYFSTTDVPDAKQDREELERFLDRLQPGWRDELVTSRFLSNVTVAGSLPLVGSAHIGGPTVDGISGLYLAGDWQTREGLLADAALGSAREATLALLAVDPV